MARPNIVGVVAPVDDTVVALPLRPGLNALHGLNGVGKTRTLKACAAAVRLHDREPVTPMRLLYRLGYVQAYHPLTASSLASDEFAEMVAIESLQPGETRERAKRRLGRELAAFYDAAPKAGPELPEIEPREIAEALVGKSTSLPESVFRDLLVDGHLLLSRRSGVGPPFGDATSVFLGVTRGSPHWADLVSAEPPTAYLDVDEEANLSTGQIVAAMDREFAHEDHFNYLGLSARPPVTPELFSGVFPMWAAVPVVHLGDIDDSYLTETFVSASSVPDDEELSRETWRAAVRVSVPFADRNKDGTTRSWSVRGASVEVNAETSKRLSEFEARANELMSVLFEKAPRLMLRPGRELHDPIQWRADLGEGPLPLANLGDAHRHFARVSIRAASQRGRGGGISLVFIDEPERAMHSLAATRVAAGLCRLGDFVVAASHSLDVLEAADNALLVERSEFGAKVRSASSSLSREGEERTAARLGVSRSQLLTSVRLFVIVEGPHDRAILNEWLPELRSRHVRLLTLTGNDVSALPEAQWLVQATSARFLIVLDSGPDAAALRRGLDVVRRAKDQEQQHAARIKWQGQHRSSKAVSRVDAFLSAAIDTGTVSRFGVFPFSEADIVYYVRPDLLIEGGKSWAGLKADFLKSVQRRSWEAGDSTRFKEWFKSRKGRLDVTELTRAARIMASEWDAANGGVVKARPDEFAKLGAHIRRLSV